MSVAFAFRKVLLAVPSAFGDSGRILDCSWLGGYMKVPRVLSFIRGLKGLGLSSTDIAHFAPEPAKEQYPRGEQQVHFP